MKTQNFLNDLTIVLDIHRELIKREGFVNLQIGDIVDIGYPENTGEWRFGFWRKLPSDLVAEFGLKEIVEQDPDCGWQYSYKLSNQEIDFNNDFDPAGGRGLSSHE